MSSSLPQQRAFHRNAFLVIYDKITPVFFHCLLFTSCLLATFSVVAESCVPDHIDEFSRLKRVVDGDTIELDDGRHLRLIGINATETGKYG